MAGRTLKWSAERAQQLLDALSAGVTQELAAAHAGVSVDTVERWRKGLSGADSDFAERFDKAAVAGGVAALAHIRQAMKDDWRAAAWLLEHRFPQHYGKQVLEHQGPGGGPIQVKTEFDYDGYLREFGELASGRAAELTLAEADGARESLDSAHADAPAGVLSD